MSEWNESSSIEHTVRNTGKSGWTSLDKTVRQVDEEQVKDLKEDMDSLLVFAGLYSAVLTAFLIESYKNLQADPQQTIIQLLQQIASQTSPRGSTFPVSTTDSTLSPTPSFSPPWSTIRVNVCWFASLIFSLSTASLGMCVKQWLREYPATECIVPQERLRIRHYRHQGLIRWRLFDLAAILPLLLQLSLALFFVGLCLFTHAVHSSIGTTSVCLVSGWAAFMVFAILAPIFSPRCPYKTTFLKGPYRLLRTRLRHLKRAILTGVVFFDDGASLATRVATFLLTADRSWLLRDSWDGVDVGELQLGVEEEDDIFRSEAYDLAIFSAVDAEMMDDQPLQAICGIIRHRKLPLKDVLTFVLGAVSHRLGIDTQLDYVSRPHPLDLRTLPLSVWVVLTDTVGDTLLHEMGTVQRIDWSADSWVGRALLLLLSEPPTSQFSPPAVSSLMRAALTNDHAGPRAYPFESLICDGAGDGCGVIYGTLINITDALLQLESKQAAYALKTILHLHFIDPHGAVDVDTNTYNQLMEQLLPGTAHRLPSPALHLLVQLSATILYNGVEVRESGAGNIWSPWMSETLTFILEATSAMASFPHDFNETRRQRDPRFICLEILFEKLFTTHSTTLPFLECMSAQSDIMVSDMGQRLLTSGLMRANVSEYDCAHILDTCNQFFFIQPHLHDALPLATTLKVCNLICALSTPPIRDLNDRWRTLFSTIASQITRARPDLYAVFKSPDSEELSYDERVAAYNILSIIDADERDGKMPYRRGRYKDIANEAYFAPLSLEEMKVETQSYCEWRDHFYEPHSPFTDEIVSVLRHISHTLADKRGRTFWRVRILEEMLDYRDESPEAESTMVSSSLKQEE